MQTLPSSQLAGEPPVHVPPPQVSFVVQASPSLHEAALSTCTQHVPGLHESSVQTLPSSQFGALPTQTPPLQASAVVQSLPSSQTAVLLA